MTPLDDATQRQTQAAEPQASTWLSANAGSGKTRVLTDRVARLLLDGVAPQNILCLTYTKAAASEMQNRLFKRLGKWSMMPDDDLLEALAGLGVALDRDRLAQARRLFAGAIETPGGLRIQTIHSFCATLLRRFPLEAGISPRFTEMDDRAAALMRDEIVEHMAAGGDSDAFDGLAAMLSDADLARVTQAVVSHRDALRRRVTLAEAAGWLGLPPDATRESIVAGAFDGTEVGLIRRVCAITDTLSKSYAGFGETLATLDLSRPDASVFETLCGHFLYASGERQHQSKSVNFPQSGHKAAVAAMAPILPELHAFMDRVAVARQQLFLLGAAESTVALYAFAAEFLEAYEARKLERGRLDFDDLIRKACVLLQDAAVAAWVLYRLDGGLDHILVDEAQDTSPSQWQVIEHLAQEFTAGLGARDHVPRSIFVVGDKKQSIYSFQGADPGEFDRMQAHFHDRLAAIGHALRPMELEYSFRSSDAILRVVDQLIARTNAPHLASRSRHRAFHDAMPGRVELWAPVPTTEKPERKNWYDPVDIVGSDHHDVILARHVAERIDEMIGTETIPLQKGGRRRVRAGDILILVRRRSRLFEEVIRACKARNLPVAGADRLKLGGELAVRDLSALIAFLATPEDDLSLACALRSPLFGWSEAELYDLAAGRGEAYLWRVLQDRAAAHLETVAILEDLRNRSDFLRPYDLIERILTRHDGRRRLLARLGPEAEDGIDALLTQALAFERAEVPSLTGFLVWMETDDVEVKRQMDSAGDLIRVMTVHGAKGLEAPIVILPDTAKRRIDVKDRIVPLAGGEMVWKPTADTMPQIIGAAVDRLKQKQEEESLRLLYVAMTRAESWLIAAGSGDIGNPGESWYQHLAGAISDIGAEKFAGPTGQGLRYAFGNWAGGELSDPDSQPSEMGKLPDWASAVPAPPAEPSAILSPSQLGGAKALFPGGEFTDDDADATRTGRLTHRLLEHLPAIPPTQWQALTPSLLATGEDRAEPDEALALLDAVRPVLTSEPLRAVFADDSLAEVAVSAAVPQLGGARVSGKIDRLIVTDDRVLAVDFKTNVVVPDTPAQVPAGLLRQMGAYLAALQQVYPQREIETAILWTRTPCLMRLPNDIVMQALLDTATS